MTDLYCAAALGNVSEVALLTDGECDDIDTASEVMYRATPLWVAARNGFSEVVRGTIWTCFYK